MKTQMKNTLPTLALALTLALTNYAYAANTQQDEFDVLLQDQPDQFQPTVPAASGPPIAAPGFGAGPRQGRAAFGPAQAGRGRGPGGFGHGQGGQGRGWPGFGPGADVSPAQLLKFLRTHVPQLFEKLSTLRQEDPDRFRRQMPVLQRLYGRVVHLMEYDPDLAQLELAQIQTRLQVQQALNTARDDQTDSPQTDSRQALTAKVAALFDAVIALERLRTQRAIENFDSWQQSADQPHQDNLAPDNPPPARNDRRAGRGRGGPGRGRAGRPPRDNEQFAPPADRPGRGPGRGRGWRGMGPRFQQRMKRRQESIERWQQNKDKIVAQHVDRLLGDYDPFPWGR